MCQKKFTFYVTLYLRKEPENMNTFDDCIQAALKDGDHNTLADFLLEKEPWLQNRFAKQLQLMTQKNMELQKMDSSNIQNMIDYIQSFHLIHPNYWDYYGYNPERPDHRYKKTQIKRWLNGENCPSREVILQICLRMVLSREDSDLLLRSAGYPALYIADMLDAIVIYYLRKYASRSHLSDEEFNEIKCKYNQVLMATISISSLKLPENGKMEEEDRAKLARFVFSQKASDKAKEIREKISQTNVNTSILITEYEKDKILNHMDSDEDFFSFLESNVTDFGGIYYGTLSLIQKYTHETRFRKNIYNYTGSFTPEDEGYILKDDSRNGELIVGAESLIGTSDTNHKNVITSILAMEYVHLKDPDKELELRRNGSLSALSLITEGRKDRKNKTYQYDIPTKKQLIRLFSAMGQEDEIGRILVRAGYWDRDWIMEKNAEACDYLSSLDWLIIYTIRYRDCLMEEWAKAQGKSIIDYKNKYREKFPFHHLLLIISESIRKRVKSTAFTKLTKIEFPVYQQQTKKQPK